MWCSGGGKKKISLAQTSPTVTVMLLISQVHPQTYALNARPLMRIVIITLWDHLSAFVLRGFCRNRDEYGLKSSSVCRWTTLIYVLFFVVECLPVTAASFFLHIVPWTLILVHKWTTSQHVFASDIHFKTRVGEAMEDDSEAQRAQVLPVSFAYATAFPYISVESVVLPRAS